MKTLKVMTLSAAFLLTPAGDGSGAILFGGFNFDDLAFADDATQLEPGSLFLSDGAVDLDAALTGFSPNTAIFNIGSGSNANLFQLDFIDLLAINLGGTDLVFFDSRFSANSYDISIRPQGGGFSSFINFNAAEFVNTGEAVGPSFGTQMGTVFSLEIELDDYGLAPGTLVDAIMFRATGGLQGDPVMAGVLNGVIPEPSRALLSLVGIATIGLRRRRS